MAINPSKTVCMTIRTQIKLFKTD